MSDPFIGEIRIFSGNYAPRGWMMCEGQILPISLYSALFTIFRNTYGGDGVTNFALPDLRGRTVVGIGQGPGLSPYTEGQQGGAESVTLNTNQLPPHSHRVTASDQPASQPGAALSYLPSNPARGSPPLYAGSKGGAPSMAQDMIQPTVGSASVATVTPYTCINYIIALEGIYPARP